MKPDAHIKALVEAFCKRFGANDEGIVTAVDLANNKVSVIDGRTNTVAATVPADKGPWAVAVNPVSNMIYVANRLSDKVTVIDGRTNGAVQR